MHGEFSANSLFVRGTALGERRLFLPGAAVSANLPLGEAWREQRNGGGALAAPR